MPEEPAARKRRAPRGRRFAAGALASVVAVFGVLALRVHDGTDPALGRATGSAAASGTSSSGTSSSGTSSSGTSSSGASSSASPASPTPSRVTATPPATTSAS
jgi:hypothetical protein